MRDLVLLAEGLNYPPSRTFNAVVVVTESFIERKRRRGFLYVVDPSIDIPNKIGISYYGFHSKMVPDIGPGCILLLLGLETLSESAELKNGSVRSSQFQLHAGNFDRVTSMKELNNDQFENFYEHPCTNELIKLSQRVKSACLTRSLSCQWRYLADIQCPGLLSNVEVTVTALELIDKKKDRAIATLSDKENCIVLTDCWKLAKSLQASYTTAQQIKITNLLSRSTDLGDIVLTTTPHTTVMSGMKSRSPALSLVDISPEESSNCDVETKSSVIISQLESISFDSLKLVFDDKHWFSISAFADAIVQLQPYPSYRDATLTFGEGHVLIANSAIIKALCASVDPELILNHQPSRKAVFDLIRGLIKEGTKLRVSFDNVKCQVLSLEIVQI